MPTTPHKLMELAAELRAGGTEAHYRAAISRAYYAAYHAVEPYVPEMPEHIEKGSYGVHAKRIQTLKQRRGSDNVSRWLRNIGQYLHVCHGFRKKADYFLGDVINEYHVRRAFTEAQSVIDKVGLLARDSGEQEAQ